MAPSPTTSHGSHSTAPPAEQAEKSLATDSPPKNVGYKALFSFTTRAHLPVILGGALSAFFAAITMPVMSVLFGLIFRQFSDHAAHKISSSQLMANSERYCVYLTATCIVCWIANSFYFTLFLSFGEMQAKSARERIFNALLRKDMEWYDTRESGIAAFLPSVQMQIRDLQLSTSVPLGEAVQCSVVGVVSLGIALYYCWNLTLVTMCTIPIVFLIMTLLSKRVTMHAHAQADKLQQALKYVTSAITHIETVKCFNGEWFELRRYTEAISLAGSLYRRQARVRSAQIGFMQFYTLSIFFQGFWYGSYLVISGKENAGDVVTTFWSSLMAVQAITEFLPQLIILQKGQVAGARLRAIMAQILEHDQNDDHAEGERPTRCVGDIQFNNVSFSYPTRTDELALNQATIFFAAGETTFVVGRSGSGKSTLGQLLVRFYSPTSGEVSIDGTPLEKLDSRWLRENVTLVEQHSTLFNDTIRRNIALGKKDRSGDLNDEEIKEVTRFAHLEPIIDTLPEGFDTPVGTKGNSLSGGQRQRVALARARLRDTPVLILDESTSALDYITRAAVIDAIRAWRRGKTTIVITHDTTQILPDDYVYILDKARVVQEGFRKDMEAEEDSHFHTFLTDPFKTPDPESESDGESDGEFDDIMSLYSDSWGGVPRPASAMFDIEPYLSPFMSPGRSSLLRTVGDTKRMSLVANDLDLRGVAPSSMLRTGLPTPVDELENWGYRVPPSAMRPASAYGAVGRPSSRASSRPSSVHGSLRQLGRPLSMDTSLRHATTRGSGRSSRPGSMMVQETNMPKPMVRAASFILDSQPVPQHRKKFWKKMGRRRRQEAQKEGPVLVPNLEISEILKSFWTLLQWRSRFALMGAVGCSVMHAAATPCFAFIFARLLSTFYLETDQHKMAMVYALSILAIATVDGLACYGFHFLFDACAQTWANSLKAEAMRRLLLQPREFFDRDENSVSRLAECLDQFGEEARNLPGRFVGIMTVAIVMIFIAIIWCLISCWKLTLVALSTGPLLYFIMAAYNATSSLWETLANEADENVGVVLFETFVNIRTVRCLVLEDEFRHKFAATVTATLGTGLKRAVYTGSLFGINYSSIFFVNTLCFWYSSYLLSRGEFETTNIVQTFTILMLSCSHVTFISNYIPQINTARDAGSRLIRLAGLPTDSHEHQGTVKIDKAGDIAFKDVDFSYPTREDQKVLQKLTFTIPRGTCTALVGSSGSGKSTVASLLLKLYRADQAMSGGGGLTISSHDVSSLHTATLRSHISLVSQTPVLFPGTVGENIAYGLPVTSEAASLDGIRRAARAAGIDDFIDSLPQGYGTLVGEGGAGLSGGQAQRIAIARALVRDPDVLILDEATSALDVESAGIVRDTVQRLVMATRGGTHGRHMTVIIITHAREMMAVAEKVVVLDAGRVVEEGRFEELRRGRGPFARLLRGGVE